MREIRDERLGPGRDREPDAHLVACLRERCLTSARRWESRGVLRTIVLMWWLRLQYAFGVTPARLARVYGRRGQ